MVKAQKTEPYLIAEVRAVQGRAEKDGRSRQCGRAGRGLPRKTERLEHVGDDILRCRRRNSEDGRVRKEDFEALKREERRTVVVSHRRKTMGFVDDEACELARIVHLLQGIHESLGLCGDCISRRKSGRSGFVALPSQSALA